MNIVELYFNLAKIIADIAARNLIVITGNIDDFGALTGLAEHFLNHIIMLLRPIKALFHLPAINNITDQIKLVA